MPDYGAPEMSYVPEAVVDEDENRVFRIWYWDPCNGMGGRSKDCGTFKHRKDAEAFINEQVGEPGSPKRLDENNWDRDAYRVEVIELK